ESNIKCGNSLIGPDFYSQQSQQMAMFDEETHYRINVFDWSGKDGFAEIMQAGGFDAVIGNPPYIRVQALNEWAPVEVNHYKKAYHSASKGNYDIYVVFVERGLSVLNKTGRLGFILPHKFFNAQYGQPLRQLLAEGQNLSNIVHFGDQQIFANATTYTCLLFLDKAANKDHFEMVKVDNLEEWRNTGKALKGKILTTNATSADWNFTIGKSAGLFEKLKAMPVKLGDVARFFVGLQTSADTVFLFKGVSLAREAITQVVSKELNKSVELESCLLKPVVRSGNIGRFWLNPTALVLFPYSLVGGKYQLIPEADMRSGFPRAWNYLTSNKSLLAEREHGKFAATGWYQLYPKNLDEWEQPKIMLPYMITRLSATYDEANNYFVNVTTGGFGMTLGADHQTMKYTIGVLNSNLLDWTLKNISTNFHGGYIAANKQFLVQLPFRPINFDNPLDKARHDQVVILVENMLDLHKRIATARTTQEKTMLQRQIDATDQQIDRLVYELYDLTDEEIKLVEGR
ncbi:MAG: Eco57I restriction-modification methylase domain-containing protein, partial [Chloroflexota bacterium]